MRTPENGTVYTGSPRDIINRISQEIVDALNASGTSPSGCHALAMIHVAASLLRQLNAEAPKMGKSPDLTSCLAVLLRGIDGAKWSDEELDAFNMDFVAIVESLGGTRMGTTKDAGEKNISIMSPTLGVH